MTNILLDTSIIITYPKLLGLSIPDVTLLVPSNVVNELNSKAKIRRNNFDNLIELIEKGEQQGTIVIVNTALPVYERFLNKNRSTRVGLTDTAIIAIGLVYKEKGEQVQIATLDIKLYQTAEKLGIKGLDINEIQDLVNKFDSVKEKKSSLLIFLEALLETLFGSIPFINIFKLLLKPLFKRLEGNTIQGKITFFEKKETANLIVGIIMGVLCTLFAVFVYFNLNHVVATINIWGTIVLVLFIGVMLFVFREKQKFSYGVFEFLVGVLTIILIFRNEHFDFEKIEFTLDFNIRLLAGLYIMVRGQDNIVKSLKDTKFGLMLKNRGIGT